MDRTLNASACDDSGLIFKITQAYKTYCILHLVAKLFPTVVLWMGSKLGHLVTMDRISDIAYGARGSIVKVTLGLHV